MFVCRLFDDSVQEKEVEQKLKDRGIKLWPVDENKGIQFLCGKVPCVFEFSAFRYNGARIANNSMRALSGSNKNRNSAGLPPPPPLDNDASRELHYPQAFNATHEHRHNSQSLRQRFIAPTNGVASETHNTAAVHSEFVDLPHQPGELSCTSSVTSSETQSGSSAMSNDEVDQHTLREEFSVQNPSAMIFEHSNVIRTSLSAADRVCAVMVAPQSVQAMEGSQDTMDGACASDTDHYSLATNSTPLPQGTSLITEQRHAHVRLDKNARTTSQTTSMPLRHRTANCDSHWQGADEPKPESWVPLKADYTDQQKGLLRKFPIAQPPKERVRVIETPINNDHPYTLPDQPKLDLANPSNDIHSRASHISRVATTGVNLTRSAELEEVFTSERVSHCLETNATNGTANARGAGPRDHRIPSQMSLNHDEMFGQVLSSETDIEESGTLLADNGAVESLSVGHIEESGTLLADNGAVESLSAGVRPMNEEHDLSDSEV